MHKALGSTMFFQSSRPQSSQSSEVVDPAALFAQLGPGRAEFRMAFSSYGPGDSGGSPASNFQWLV